MKHFEGNVTVKIKASSLKEAQKIIEKIFDYEDAGLPFTHKTHWVKESNRKA